MAGLQAARQSPVWLLDFDVGGRVYRFATEPVEVTAANGDTYAYDPGLTPPEMGMLRSFGAREVELTIHSLIDWAKIEAQGIALEDRRVIVRLHYSGEVLEQCHQLLDGNAEIVSHPGLGEPITLTVVEDIERGAIAIPGAQAVVSDETWPVRTPTFEPAESALGKTYPIPVGYPGDHPKPGASVDIAEPAYPAPWVEEDSADAADRLLVAPGRIDAAQVTAFHFEDGVLQVNDVSTARTADALGTSVTYVQQAIVSDETNEETYVGLRKASGYGGGIISPYTGEVLRGAGEVFRYFLDYFTDARLDHDRIKAHQVFFDRFKVDGVIGLNGSERVTDFVRRAVLDVVPGLLVDGPAGLYLAPLRWDAEKHHRVAHIDIDKGHASVVGSFAKWGEPIQNRFTIDYRPRWGNQYVSRRELTSIEKLTAGALTGGVRFPPLSLDAPWVASGESDTRVAGSSLLRSSQARFGMREADPLQLPSCWDDATANLFLYYLAMKHAWPKRIGRIESPTLSTLLPGDVITLTQSSNHLDEHVAMVLDRSVVPTTVRVDVVLLDGPTQANRLTS